MYTSTLHYFLAFKKNWGKYDVWIKSGPNLDKDCVRFSYSASPHEILIKNYFVVKYFKNVWIEGNEIPRAFFFCKKSSFC